MATKIMNAAETARQTLSRLAALRLPPTPENYRRVYDDIAGGHSASDSPQFRVIASKYLEKQLGNAADSVASALAECLERKDWDAFFQCLVQQASPGSQSTPVLGEGIRHFVRQWERRQKGLSHLQKQMALDQLCGNCGDSPDVFALGLSRLAKTWEAMPDIAVAHDDAQDPVPVQELSPEEDSEPAIPLSGSSAQFHTEALRQWRELLTHVLRYGVAPRLSHIPDLAAEAQALAKSVSALDPADDTEALAGMAASLKDFWFRVETHADLDRHLQEKLVALLRLLVDNVCELVLEDKWLVGQLEGIKQLLVEPLRVSAISQAEEQFKEIIYKQGILKHNLVEARESLKHMVGLILTGIEQVSMVTGAYYQTIRNYSEKIRDTEDLEEINVILQEILQHSRGLEERARLWFDELNDARLKMEQAEARIKALEHELEEISQLVQEDPLTGALNRRGMAAAFTQAFSRASRLNSPLSVALLDIDHFKEINDGYGHELGDQVLKHLVKVLKTQLRPTDVLARSGGEEFVILLPDTEPDMAAQVLTRLQTALARKTFRQGGASMTIRFSAGLVRWRAKESMDGVLERADQAMYQAKKTGRNRIMQSDGEVS